MKGPMSPIPEPAHRYDIGQLLGQGVFGKVYLATDSQASNKKVAVKIQPFNKDTKFFIEEEYAILKDSMDCPVLPTFYGIFKTTNEVWFIMESCHPQTLLDLVLSLQRKNRRLSEEHISYILKDVVKAITYLHETNIVHRDIKASNILLTKEGEVKLCDFGLAVRRKSSEDKMRDCVGSPCWIAPEVISLPSKCGYDCRVDVWGVGVMAIEIAEGQAPYQNMPPSRVLMQIVKNPPPKLMKISNWSEDFHDFISECLTKYYEYRPYVMELMEHPFMQKIPENNYHLSLEIKSTIESLEPFPINKRPPECVIIGKKLKTSIDGPLEKVLEEDLADLQDISEPKVIRLLEERFNLKQYFTFIGDVLLSINSNGQPFKSLPEIHRKYFQKSRSENAPHIYAVADTAYQNALHHKTPQQIVLSGESASGKTTNFLHLIDHFCSIAEQLPVSVFRFKNAVKLVHALTHISTPNNAYSTRCVLKTHLSFGQTGKLTGASFKTLCLEKWRVSSVDMSCSNFHMLYYVYDGLVYSDATKKYKLHSKRDYRYLRILQDLQDNQPRSSVDSNIIKYKKIFSYLEEFEFSEQQISTFFSVIAAVLNLGEIRFSESEEGAAIVKGKEFCTNVANLLELDENKFVWALTNYCVLKQACIIKKKNTCDEARDGRDVLANNLYVKLVDYLVRLINEKLAIGKAIFGAKYAIHLLDYFGFECFKQNHLEQLMVNTFNEQLQFHYTQRVFSWEVMDLQTEEIQFEEIMFFSNKETLNQILSKPYGVVAIIDDTSKRNLGGRCILDNLRETNRIMIRGKSEFSVAHYTGVVTYNSKEMADKNRDFLPPEMIKVMRESENPIVQALFLSKLDKTGNLVLNLDGSRPESKKKQAIQFSQVSKLRTSLSIFRSVSLELLKELSVGGSGGGTHFVRCLRSNLENHIHVFNKELVKQQIRAMSVVETAKIRQKGYPHRINFAEFLRRYKFLAFDFDETVEFSKENCRLLLVRLKMEGWAVGQSHVFLKYYNEEYLSRLYEHQVKKIVKIQSIMRAFLTKCRLKKKTKELEKECIEEIKTQRRRSSVLSPDEAAEIIQKAYRKTALRNKTLSEEFELLTAKERKLVAPFAKKWKRQSLISVLMKYRAIKLYDFFNLSQQVHFYNQSAFFHLQKTLDKVDLDRIEPKAQLRLWLGDTRPVILKIKYRLDEIPFYDTSSLRDPLTNVSDLGEENWDSPYQWRSADSKAASPENRSEILNLQFSRNPEEPLERLPDEEQVGKLQKDIDNEIVAGDPKSPVSKVRFREEKNEFPSGRLKRAGTRYEPRDNSTPANKDFEFIRTVRPKNPVAELKSLAQRKESEDDPPFNFQAMLRKTNYQKDISEVYSSGTRRDSLKNAALGVVRKLSLSNSSEPISTKPVFMELVPGLVLEGVEVDL